MAKTNFSKVESLIEKGIEKRKISNIVDQTRPDAEISSDKIPKLYLIESIRYDVAAMPHFDEGFFKKIGVKKQEILRLIKNPNQLTDKDWQLVQEIHDKIDARKEQIKEELPDPSDEDIIEFEKRRHIYKRFNVNETWLPLY
jgi:hypothetical protein